VFPVRPYIISQLEQTHDGYILYFNSIMILKPNII